MPVGGDYDYDSKGAGYAAQRRPDPRIGAFVTRALGDARTVLNVGAGAGSYEPTDRYVLAVEPSATMRARSSSRRTVFAVSSSEIANEPLTSGFACSHIFGSRPPEPAPSTKVGVNSTGTGTPSFASAAVTGAPVSGSQT